MMSRPEHTPEEQTLCGTEDIKILAYHSALSRFGAAADVQLLRCSVRLEHEHLVGADRDAQDPSTLAESMGDTVCRLYV